MYVLFSCKIVFIVLLVKIKLIFFCCNFFVKMSAVLCVSVKDYRNWEAVFAHIRDMCRKYMMSFYSGASCPPSSFPQSLKDEGFGLKEGYRGLLFDPGCLSRSAEAMSDIVIPGMIVESLYSEVRRVVCFFV